MRHITGNFVFKYGKMFIKDEIQELAFLLQHFKRRGIPIEQCNEKERIYDLVTELLICFGLPSFYDYILYGTVNCNKITVEMADEFINKLERARTLVEFERSTFIFKNEFNPMNVKIFVQKNFRPAIPISYLNDILTGFYTLYRYSPDLLEPEQYYHSIITYLQTIEQPVRREIIQKVVDLIFRYFKLISQPLDF